MEFGKLSPKLWLPLFLVIITGCAAAYYLWFTYMRVPVASYPFEWGQAHWLSHADTSARDVYYRKQFTIPEGIKNASLQVLATDTVGVYVNGNLVDNRNFTGVKISGIYDVRRLLHPGQNIVAISAGIPRFRGQPMLAARLDLVDRVGTHHFVETDDTWRADTLPQVQGSDVTGPRYWYMKEYDADSWPLAHVGKVPDRHDLEYPILTVQSVGGLERKEIAYSVPYPLFSTELGGSWLGLPDDSSENLHFRRKVLKSEDIGRVWVRVAAVGEYSLMVNGLRVARERSSETTFTMSDLTSYMKDGGNIIAINLFEPKRHGKVFCDIMMFTREGKPVTVPSDSNWKVSSITSDGWPRPGYDDSSWKPAAELTSLTQDLNRNRVKAVSDTDPEFSYYLLEAARMTLFCCGIVFGFVALWLFFFATLTMLPGMSTDRVLLGSALLHLPVLAYFIAITLLGYEVRLPPSYFFSAPATIAPLVALAVLYFVTAIELLARRLTVPPEPAPLPGAARGLGWTKGASVAAIVALMAVAFYLRTKDMSHSSFWHDELGTMYFARGIMKCGLPSSVIIADVVKYKVMNFLVPYSALPFLKIFGENELGNRFAYIMYGVLTTLMIYVLGSRMFGRKTALVVAVIYALSPWSIYWCKAKYPAQCQFFSFLSIYFFYRLYEDKEEVRAKFVYLNLAAFLVAFYSWQGCGFLPMAFGVLMAMRKQRRWWVNPHMVVYAVVSVYAVYMALQLAIYSFYAMPMMHQGLAARIDSATQGTKQFLAPWFEPTWYFRNLLFMDHHQLLGLLSLATIPLAFRHDKFRFLAVLIFVPLLGLTYLNPRHVTHYMYYLQPIVMLAGVSVLFFWLDWLLERARGIPLLQWGVRVSALSLAALLVFSCSSYVLHLYNMPAAEVWYLDWASSRGEFTDIAYADDVGAMSRRVKSMVKPDDLIIGAGVSPLVLEYYFGHADSLIGGGIPGDEAAAFWAPERRYIFYEVLGAPVMTSVDEFKEEVNSHRRVWVVATKAILEERPDLGTWSKNHLNLYFETYTACLFAKLS